MQQLSGSSGRGGTHTPATNVLLFLISERLSNGDESREEKRIAGPESSTCSESVDWIEEEMKGDEGEAVVGAFDAIEGMENSRSEA